MATKRTWVTVGALKMAWSKPLPDPLPPPGTWFYTVQEVGNSQLIDVWQVDHTGKECNHAANVHSEATASYIVEKCNEAATMD
jgi:hypothetical protein